MPTPIRVLACMTALCALGCSGADGGPRLPVGTEPENGGGLAGSAGVAPTGQSGGNTSVGGGSPGGSVSAGSGSVGTRNELSVHVEDMQRMTIEVITLQCAGDCADVEAVASGGNPPYAFAWEDGSTSAQRRVCLDASATLTVNTTDTAIETDEFRYNTHTATATLTANVIDCTPDADAAVPSSDCGAAATLAFLVVAKQPSTFTTTYTQANGNLPDYVASSFGGGPLAIVGRAQRTIDLGSCTKLLLAGNATGTQNVGWDDSMVVEYRSVRGGPVDERWCYGTVTLTYTPDNQVLTSRIAPSVPGTSLDPPVPNPLPFGYPPLAIDLMSEIPAGARGFELTIYVLDSASVGSTTDIWAIPRP